MINYCVTYVSLNAVQPAPVHRQRRNVISVTTAVMFVGRYRGVVRTPRRAPVTGVRTADLDRLAGGQNEGRQILCSRKIVDII